MTIDIKHLEYFIAIVENNYNLSKAAETLFVSQPALTKYIKEFENEESTKLFIRYKNRLVDLTPAGRRFLENARIVTNSYQQLMSDLRSKSDRMRGTVKLGIPPVVISVLFRTSIPKFILENPDINLEIIEAGASELERMLLLQEIDIAILLEPISHPNINSKRILSNQVVAIFNTQHPLAKEVGPVAYKELEKEKLVILNDSFMLHHQTIGNFKLANAIPDIFLQSGQWDLLVSICEKLNTVIILPAPILDRYPKSTIMTRPLEPSFGWFVSVSTLNNVYKNELTAYTEDFFVRNMPMNKVKN